MQFHSVVAKFKRAQLWQERGSTSEIDYFSLNLAINLTRMSEISDGKVIEGLHGATDVNDRFGVLVILCQMDGCENTKS